MNNRFDNKRLLYILAGLVVILVFTVLVKIPKEKATLKYQIVDFDTSEVTTILLTPKAVSGKPFEFRLKDGKWLVKQENTESLAREYEVDNIMQELLSVKPQNLVSKNRSEWNKYEVTDSTGTRIQFRNKKNKVLSDVVVGKFTYKQTGNQMSMYGRPGIKGTSYIRLSGEDEVYGVDGFLALSFNRTFNDWRDNTFISFSKDDVIGIRFIYPADSSFHLNRKDSLWIINSKDAGTSAVDSYLSTLQNLTGQEFNDNFKPSVNPDYQLHIEGNNLLDIKIKCYRQPDGNFVMNSSLNPDIYFNSKADGIFGKVFRPENGFLTSDG